MRATLHRLLHRRPAGTGRAPWPGQGDGDTSGNGDLLRRATETIEPATVSRYAEAAGDHYAIHLDDEYARSRGLSGVIVHGMCTLAFAARQVREACSEHGVGEITALRCRFKAPVRPG